MSGYVLHLPEEESVVLSGPAARRLVSAGNGDAALLYIALVQNRGAADGEKLRAALGWPTERFAAAFQALESHYQTLVRYLNLTDMGMVLGYGCGTPAMTQHSEYLQQAYNLGKQL